MDSSLVTVLIWIATVAVVVGVGMSLLNEYDLTRRSRRNYKIYFAVFGVIIVIYVTGILTIANGPHVQ